MEKKFKREEVFYADLAISGDAILKGTELFAKFKTAINHPDFKLIDIEYWDDECEVRVWIDREETDDEYDARIAKERKASENRKKRKEEAAKNKAAKEAKSEEARKLQEINKEAEERATYERLKKKFGY